MQRGGMMQEQTRLDITEQIEGDNAGDKFWRARRLTLRSREFWLVHKRNTKQVIAYPD